MIRNILIKGINYSNILQEKISKIIEKIKEKIKIDKTIFLVFISIFIVQYFFSSVIYIYFDDFGNASLSYSYITPNVVGTNYTFAQLIEWAIQIYNNWGGRIFYAIAFIIPLLRLGINVYMFVQSIVITFIIYYMYKIVQIFSNQSKKNIFIPVSIIALYLCLNIEFLRLGVYWASASVLYVWPLLPLFSFIYYYLKEIKLIENGKKISFKKVLILMILAFLATFSQEQIGPSIIAFFIICIIYHHPKKIKNYLKMDLPIFFTIIISFLALFLAPGNWKRLDGNQEFAALSFFEKIIVNYPLIMNMIFIKLKFYMSILTIIMFYMMYNIVVKNYVKEGKKNYCLILILGIILIVNYFFVKLANDITYKNIYLSIFGTIWLLLMLIVSYIFFKDNKIIEVLSIEFSAVASIFCLLMSPTIVERTGIPFLFFIILITVLILNNILNKKCLFKYAIYIMILIILIYGIKTSITIYDGYKVNYGIHQLNYDILKNYNSKEDGKQINLYKVKNSYYGSVLPYEWDYSMDIWIQEYFNIPHDVTFNWIDIYNPTK